MASYDFRPLTHRASSARSMPEMESTSGNPDVPEEGATSSRSVCNVRPASADPTDGRNDVETGASQSAKSLNQTWHVTKTYSHESNNGTWRPVMPLSMHENHGPNHSEKDDSEDDVPSSPYAKTNQ